MPIDVPLRYPIPTFKDTLLFSDQHIYSGTELVGEGSVAVGTLELMLLGCGKSGNIGNGVFRQMV